MKTVAIIQARMSSTRLPGKVLLSLAGVPMLERVINRLTRSSHIDQVVVATSCMPADDVIVDLCRRRSCPLVRGSEMDVLDRYYQSAIKHEAELIVRVTSDCPLIDIDVVDEVIGTVLGDNESAIDYASNTFPHRTFPRGLDTEAFRLQALEVAWQQDKDPSWREHVTPYIYRHPEKFVIRAIVNDLDYSHLRWTVDTAEDFEFVTKVYEHFGGQDTFSWHDVLTLLGTRPEWVQINKNVEQKSI